MAGDFEDVVAAATIAHSVEGTHSVGPYSAYAADPEENIFWFVQFFCVNSKMFFDFDGLANVYIESAGKEFFSGGALEHSGVLVHAAREVL
jgi:hypothetical protein